MVRTRSGKTVEIPSNDAPRPRKRAKVTKSPPKSLLQWAKLPLIVQDEVLKQLAGDYNRYSSEDRRCRANYAAVSLQWQGFFEKLNFDKLVLRPAALRDFGRIVRRRSYAKKSGSRGRQKPKKASADESSSPSRMPRIRHIWLCIILPYYYCGRCKQQEAPTESNKNNIIFTKAISTLLKILSDWEDRDPNHMQALTLELSAHSPSDAQHCFRGDAGLQRGYPNLGPISAQRDFIMRYEQEITSEDGQLNDLFHGYSAGQFSLTTIGTPYRPQSAAERVINPLEFDFFGFPSSKHKFPEVKMISTFLVRRQFYRELYPDDFGKLLSEALVGLRNIRYERWRLPDTMDQELYQVSFGPTETNHGTHTGLVIGDSLPSSLEVLSLFEERSTRSPNPGDLDWLYAAAGFWCSNIRVLDGLAGRAVNLKHLSVSFISDAMDCFKFPADAFPNLLSLAMTSQEYLEPDDGNIRKLFLEAARAVAKLPKLQILELWNCEDGHAAILRYEAAGAEQISHTCELTWRTSWDSTESTIGTGVMKAWEKIAHRASRQLNFVLDPLAPGPFTKYGEILHHLKLRDFILDPVSAMQARVGLEVEGQPEVPAWKESVPYSPVWKAGR